MQLKYETHYIPALYTIVGILLVVNLLALMSGAWLALVAIGIQVVIIASVYARKTWAYLVVRVWSAICILAGVLIWLAVLLRGFEFSHSAGYMIFQTLLLLVGLYFFKGAKVALMARGPAETTPPEMHQEDI